MVAAILINIAISLSEGEWAIFDEVVGAGTAFTLANTGLALVAAMAVQEHPAAILLVALPAATTFLAGKAYAEVQLKHDNVVLLQRSTRLAQGSLQLAEMLPALLDHVREMFHADIAEVMLWPDADRPYLCSQVGPGEGRTVLEPVTPDPWRAFGPASGRSEKGSCSLVRSGTSGSRRISADAASWTRSSCRSIRRRGARHDHDREPAG